MKVSYVRQNVLPVVAAAIWGGAFAAQSVSAAYLPPFAINTARSVVAFFSLLILCLGRRGVERHKGMRRSTNWKELALGGFFCGAALTIAAYLQQKGMETTSSGKAGFITALYIVIVPIVGLFFHRRVNKTVWMGVALAVVGLYCLCVTEGFSITRGDFYILLCAFCYSGYILVVDYFGQRVDGTDLSCVQFLVQAILSGAGSLAMESVTASGFAQCLLPILYLGVFASGVGYTLQILAQKGSNPTVVSLLLSLEALFATIAGALLLHDRMSTREYVGCALMLAAVMLAQLPSPQKKKSAKEKTA